MEDRRRRTVEALEGELEVEKFEQRTKVEKLSQGIMKHDLVIKIEKKQDSIMVVKQEQK